MKTSLVALCFFVLVKLISGASQNIGSIGQLKQRIALFEGTIEELHGQENFAALKKLLSSPDRTSAERVWQFVKYFQTLWSLATPLISEGELQMNIPSILIADNPEFLYHASNVVYQNVMDPSNLAAYDAVNLAKTLTGKSRFAYLDLPKLGATRIIELLEKRVSYDFNPTVAIGTGNIEILQRYIDLDIWTPCIHDVVNAILSDAQEGLLFLLKSTNRMPSALCINHLAVNDRSDALDCIRQCNPGWSPTQEDIDYAAVSGLVLVLDWYASIDPNMIPPSECAVKQAHILGRLNVIEWFNVKYPYYYGYLI